MRYDNNTKSADLVPAPVIEHFLKDAAQPPYEGFPRAGMTFANTRDPQLRRYMGLIGQATGGVYVTDVLKNSPAEKAGLKKGDIVLSVDGQGVDQDGNYNDSLYGKISVVHLLSTRHFHGSKVKLGVMRDRAVRDLEMTVAHRPGGGSGYRALRDRPAAAVLSAGWSAAQELSRQYLKEWGADWLKKAPEELVYYDRQQNELFRDGPKKTRAAHERAPFTGDDRLRRSPAPYRHENQRPTRSIAWQMSRPLWRSRRTVCTRSISRAIRRRSISITRRSTPGTKP
jgi:hypothetical protein